jgi:carboxymethylenebutenolidase
MQEVLQTLTDADGGAIPGYLARAARDQAVIVVPDVFGLTEQMRGVARKFAAEGFHAFAIDLLDGRTTDDPALGFKNAQLVVWKAAMERIRVTTAALAELSRGKVGIVGFGFGAAAALAGAAHVPELAGCVVWYGMPTPTQANFARITCKVQGHFARFDQQISNDRVDGLEAKLAAAGVEAELHRYHAEHFFFDETRRASHSMSNTDLSFRRAIAFLRMQLTGSYT